MKIIECFVLLLLVLCSACATMSPEVKQARHNAWAYRHTTHDLCEMPKVARHYLNYEECFKETNKWKKRYEREMIAREIEGRRLQMEEADGLTRGLNQITAGISHSGMQLPIQPVSSNCTSFIFNGMVQTQCN